MESLFPFLVMIAYAVISWYVKKKQSEKDADRTSPPPDEQGKEWDELLEALGQKPSSKAPEPVTPAKKEPPVFAPPRVQPPAASIPTPKKAAPMQAPWSPSSTKSPSSFRAFDPEKLVEEEMKSLEAEMSSLSKPLAPALSEDQHTLKNPNPGHFSKLLGNKRSLRDAVVLNEILQPPVALRP